MVRQGGKGGAPAGAEPVHVTVRGVTYDVTDFMRKHPGGNVLAMYNGLDATDAFEAFHTSAKPLKYLSNLPVVAAPAGAKPKGEVDALTRDFRALVEDWKARGLYRASIPFWAAWCAAVLGAIAASFQIKGWAGGVLLGVAWAQCGFIQHHAAHMGWLNTQRVFECLLKGGSARWWRNRHTKHHAFPNHHGRDGDLRTNPFLAWDAELAKRCPSSALRVQHVAFIPLLAFYVPVFFMTTKMYLMRSWAALKGEIALVVAHWALALALVPTRDLVQLYGIGYVVQGVYLGLFFSLSHFHMPRLNDPAAPWPKMQVQSTSNWSAGAPFWRLASGFLNLQIEHHWAPAMPPENLSVVAPQVRALCKKHKLAYLETGVWGALCATLGGLRLTALAELKERAAH